MPDPAGPPLISVRGWSAEDDPRYHAFVGRLRDSGVEVVDLWVPPDGFATMGLWSAAVRAEVDALLGGSGGVDAQAVGAGAADGSLHLLGYCLGGHILLELIAQLQDAGRAPAYVGLIDCWYRPPAHWIDRGIYGRYGVAWPRRLRHQLGRLTPPRVEPVAVVARSWAVRAARTSVRVARGGRVAAKRGRILNWHGQHLAYDWFYRRLRVPIHVYNAEASVADMDDDPSLGLSMYLTGGFTAEVLAGTDHRTCLEPPSGDQLTGWIARDRAAATGASAIPSR